MLLKPLHSIDYQFLSASNHLKYEDAKYLFTREIKTYIINVVCSWIPHCQCFTITFFVGYHTFEISSFGYSNVLYCKGSILYFSRKKMAACDVYYHTFVTTNFDYSNVLYCDEKCYGLCVFMVFANVRIFLLKYDKHERQKLYYYQCPNLTI